MSDFLYIDSNTKSYVEKTSQANVSKGLYNNYQIANSCIFNSSSSQYLNRTPASAGNRKTWTWSGWVKRGSLGTAQMFLHVGTTNAGGNFGDFGFDSSDQFSLNVWAGPTLSTTMVFRDTSNWYHIIISVDTTQSIASDRVKIYVNGNRISSFSTDTISSNYTQNYDTAFNQALQHSISSRLPYFSDSYLNAYLTEVNFIDGQALDQNSFGYFDNQRDFVWKPKRYSGTYGINGFYLPFNDTSNIGRDFSGNSNNWTTNGSMVGTGTSSNIVSDSPTNNFCTYNQLAKNSAVTLSNGNMILASTNNRAQGTTFVIPTTGKWYAEFIPLDAVGVGGTFAIGIIGADTNFIGGSISMITTSSGIQTIAYIDNANRNVNGTIGSSGGATYGINDIIGVAVDADNGSVSFYKNNSLQFTVSGTSYTNFSGTWMFGAEASASSKRVQFNAGQRAFSYTPPTGFRSLCSANLPVPLIKKPNQYMDVVTYTGTGSSRSITGLGFSPDLVWIKDRSVNNWHNVLDTIRGGNSRLSTNSTNAEDTGSAGGATPLISAFNSDGFTLPNGNDNTNKLSNTYVAWAWDAGSSSVTNTDGSITSTVRVNKDAGFSIVSFTKTLATATQTVGHGLGAVPKMMIVKGRTSNATSNWRTWHSGISISQYYNLESQMAAATSTQMWANTNPTSSVFSIGSDFNNAADANYIAYLWSEIEGYSKFGSYTGNGSADGPFVYCGFRPAFIMVKGSSFGSNWFINDNKRPNRNVITLTALRANLSNVESNVTTYDMDFTSNGFKIRTSEGDSNTSSATFIFAAFAESPFKYSLAR